MADLSKKEWEKYEEPQESHVYKQIATVMQKGISPDEVAEFYSKWASGLEYEKELPPDVYNAPIITALEAAEGFTDEQKSTAKVFDVAAGTGMCAVQLRKHGFKHIDALDPSQGMLDKAKEKNLYERYICDFITEKPLDIEENTYDLLTICGGMGEGHVPCNALYEMVRLVKPGGRVIIVTKESHRYVTEDYKGRLEPLMDDLEKNGKWTKVKCEIIPEYMKDSDGLVWVFQIC
ncbi:Methyltransferase domain [Mactra antiquata]